MSDVLTGLHVASGDAKLSAFAAVLSALVGAFIGALLGALATYLLSERARKNQKESDEILQQRLKIRAHETSYKRALSELESGCVLILKNIQHYQTLQAGIIDEKRFIKTTISLPQPYPHIEGLGTDMLSSDMLMHWQSYEGEIVLQNANLNELNEYYVALRTDAHHTLLTGGTLNPQVIDQDNKVLIQGAIQQIEANEHFLNRCLGLLAHIELDAKQWKDMDFTTIRLDELTNHMDKLRAFKPNTKKHAALVESFRQQYTPENAFKVAGKQV